MEFVNPAEHRINPAGGAEPGTPLSPNTVVLETAGGLQGALTRRVETRREGKKKKNANKDKIESKLLSTIIRCNLITVIVMDNLLAGDKCLVTQKYC